MANWLYTIQLPEFQKCQNEEGSLEDVIRAFLEQIQIVPQELRDEIEWELEELQGLLDAGDPDPDDFDDVWETIYNWADENRIWINIF